MALGDEVFEGENGGNGGRGREKEEDPGDWCSSRSSVCSFILFFYNTVRINYNLPAG